MGVCPINLNDAVEFVQMIQQASLSGLGIMGANIPG